MYCVFLAFCHVFLRLLIVAFRKKERAAADARSPAGRRYRDANTVLAYVRCFFECCLYANVWELSGKLWFLMITLQLQGRLSAICSWVAYCYYFSLSLYYSWFASSWRHDCLTITVFFRNSALRFCFHRRKDGILLYGNVKIIIEYIHNIRYTCTGGGPTDY